MIVPSEVAERLNFVQPYVEFVGEQVRNAVVGFCGERGYAYTSRFKTAASLAEKLESGQYRSWSELDDLFACAVIVPTLAEEADVLAFLRGAFELVKLKERGSTKKDPSVFRFDATRFIGRLRLSDPTAVHPLIRSTSFEIQIRSAFEHAWSVTTHALAYKAARVDWKTMRLAAQLKAAVEQLDGLVLAYEQAAGVVSEHEWPEVSAKKHIEDVFLAGFADGAIPAEMEPTNWQRFCDNVFSLLSAGRQRVRRDPMASAQVAGDALAAEFAALPAAQFPTSLSLLQFTLGVLTREGVIRPPLDADYTPLVSQALIDLYPAVRAHGRTFDLEAAAAPPAAPMPHAPPA